MTNPLDPSLLDRLLSQRDWVRSLARQLVRDEGAAEDVAQETLLRALRRPPRHGRQLRAWLARVVRSVVREGSRAERARRRRERTVAGPPSPQSADELAQRLELQRELAEAVLALPAPQREVVLLRFFGDCTTAETARRLDLPPGTVESRQHRALATLRQRLDARHGALVWPLVLRRWLSRDVASATATGAAATTAGAILVASTTTKAVVAAGVAVVLATGWWVRSVLDDSEPRGALPSEALREGSWGEGLDPSSRRSRLDADRELASSGAGEAEERAADSSPQLPRLELELGDGLEHASILLFSGEDFLGPRDAGGTGVVRFEPPPAWPNPLRALLLHPRGIPELRELPQRQGRVRLESEAGPAELEGHFLLDGQRLDVALPFQLSLEVGGEAFTELSASVRRAAGIRAGISWRVGFSSAADGSFQVTGLPSSWRGSLELGGRFRIEGASAGRVVRGALQLDVPTRELRVEVEPAVCVSGRIVDEASSRPLPLAIGDCFVRLADGRSSPVVAFEADEHGRFLVHVRSSDRSEVHFDDPSSRLRSIALTILRGGIRKEFHLEAEPLDPPGDVGDLPIPAGVDLRLRAIDPDGAPIAGARAWAGSPSEPADDAGWIVLRQVDPARREVVVDAVGHAPARRSLPTSEPLGDVELGPTTRLDVVLPVMPVRRLRVVLRADESLLGESSGHRALRSVLEWGGGRIAESLEPGRTELSLPGPDDGRMSLEDLHPGVPFTLELHDAFAGLLHRQSFPALREGERREWSWSPELEPIALAGCVVDEAGQPVHGATVRLRSKAGALGTRTDADGAFEFASLLVPAGRSAELSAQTERASSEVQSLALGNRRGLLLRLREHRSFRVAVLDPDGQPVPVRSAHASAAGRSATVQTLEDGRLLVTKLSAWEEATLTLEVGDQEIVRSLDPGEDEGVVRVGRHGVLELSLDPASIPSSVPAEARFEVQLRRVSTPAAPPPPEAEWTPIRLGIDERDRRVGALPLRPGPYELYFVAQWLWEDEQDNIESRQHAWPPRQVEVVAGAPVRVEE